MLANLNILYIDRFYITFMNLNYSLFTMTENKGTSSVFLSNEKNLITMKALAKRLLM